MMLQQQLKATTESIASSFNLINSNAWLQFLRSLEATSGSKYQFISHRNPNQDKLEGSPPADDRKMQFFQSKG